MVSTEPATCTVAMPVSSLVTADKQTPAPRPRWHCCSTSPGRLRGAPVRITAEDDILQGGHHALHAGHPISHIGKVGADVAQPGYHDRDDGNGGAEGGTDDSGEHGEQIGRQVTLPPGPGA